MAYRKGAIKMKKNLNGKMSSMELDMIAGGAGYCYWAKVGNKYNYVCADRPLNRDEILKVWNHKGLGPMVLPPRTDERGNVLPQTQNVWRGEGLKAEHVEQFVQRNNQRFGGACNYIEFK